MSSSLCEACGSLLRRDREQAEEAHTLAEALERERLENLDPVAEVMNHDDVLTTFDDAEREVLEGMFQRFYDAIEAKRNLS